MRGSTEKIGIGLIGFGHWGPYHARVFSQMPDECRLQIIADREGGRLEAASRQYADAEITTDFETVLRHPEVNAVVIATPTNTHYSLVKTALLSGKDVLVEKPITYTSAEADELIELAEKHRRVLMCGHIFLYNAGIRKLKQYIGEGVLGRIYYMAATRTNLGPLRRDLNALYDLGSHDVSIFDYLLSGRPCEVAAWGECYLQHDIEDVTFACLEYSNKTLCHMHVSWLNPRKERTLVVVGAQKMVVWDDTSPVEMIRLYDKWWMEEPFYDSFGHFQLSLRDADVLIPQLKADEPLKMQDQHFLECVQTRNRPLTDGVFARNVVHTLEVLQRSLRKGGSRQPVNYPER
jgi:predicted dehydrogenase